MYKMTRIIMMSFLLFNLGTMAYGQMVFENTAPNKPIFTEYYAIAEKINKNKIKIVKSVDGYASHAQVVLKNVTPTGKEGKYSEIKAEIERIAIPGAGSPGVTTYVEVNGSKDNPLRIAKNLVIWQGTFYVDGTGMIFMSEGTSYEYNGKDIENVVLSREIFKFSRPSGWEWFMLINIFIGLPIVIVVIVLSLLRSGKSKNLKYSNIGGNFMATRTITLPIKQPPHPMWFVSIIIASVVLEIVSAIFRIILKSEIASILGIFTQILSIWSTVICYVFLFRLWQLAYESTENIKKPTPYQAILFSLIPFFNLYWAFILWRNLAIHLNSLTNNNRIPVELVTVGVALLASIILAPIGGIILLITSFSFYKSAMELLPCTTTSQSKTYTQAPAKAPVPDWFKKGI